jgi:hypothetical protein
MIYEHATHIRSIYCLAHLLHMLRQYLEAVELYERTCDGYTQQLGSQHPSSVACCNRFAATQQAAGQPKLASGESLSPGSFERVSDTEICENDR